MGESESANKNVQSGKLRGAGDSPSQNGRREGLEERGERDMQREAQQEKMSRSTCEPLNTWSQLWGLSGGGRGAHRAAEQGGQDSVLHKS